MRAARGIAPASTRSVSETLFMSAPIEFFVGDTLPKAASRDGRGKGGAGEAGRAGWPACPLRRRARMLHGPSPNWWFAIVS
jgi:hypothetical protein